MSMVIQVCSIAAVLLLLSRLSLLFVEHVVAVEVVELSLLWSLPLFFFPKFKCRKGSPMHPWHV